MAKKYKPVAVEITSWHPYMKIIYKCPRCRQDFRMFGDKEKFCHNCGTKIDWDVIKSLPKPFNKNNLEEEKRLIKYINDCQLGQEAQKTKIKNI